MEKTKPVHCDTHKQFQYDCMECVEAATKPVDSTKLIEAVGLQTRKHEPGSDLTTKQTKAAHNLRVSRPMCIPGTNAIIVKKEADIWHTQVALVAIAAKVQPAQEEAFFDACGVAE